jgi:murein DD-endopeptidase MepM/ murein hydrolase activator NlpD
MIRRPHQASSVMLSVFAALLLGACVHFGGTRISHIPTPLEPPPIPQAKPKPPAAVAAASGAGAAARRIVAAAVTTVPLAPVKTVSRSTAVSKTTAVSRNAASSTAPSMRPAGRHVVRRGDTVHGVARRYGVPIRAVIDANGLRPPYTLKVAQRLAIPQPRRHMVVKGDTVYGVSRRYGVNLTELVRLNRIAAPYKLALGQDLILPVPGGGAAPAGQLAAASQTGAPLPAIQRSAAPKTPAKVTAARPTATQTTALGSPSPAPRSTVPKTSAPKASAPKAVARPAAIPQPPPRAGGKFLWPVQGRMIKGFGSRQGGLHNDGINIAAPLGTPVRAAENGVVAYVGNELRGFGNLILLKHTGGWVTAYAHTDAFLVKRGQRVKRGQAIARIGSSGNVSRPQLHFEIRKGTRAVNPALFLGAQKAAVN